MTWTCVQIEERLSDYLDGLLPENEQREFRAHVDACPRCAPLLAQVTLVVGRLRTLDPEPVSPVLISKILDQTLGPRKTQRDWFGWLPMLWQPRFAMGAVTVLATLFITFQATGVRASNITAANLNPVNIYHSADRHAHLAFARSVKFVNDLRVVYEIQSRLQPSSGPAPNNSAPPPAPSQPKSPNESRQNHNTNGSFALLATLLADAPGRSLR
ncbi:MAG: anti-sigma factor family protein [Candidatus Acidiferrales bacterium]